MRYPLRFLAIPLFCLTLSACDTVGDWFESEKPEKRISGERISILSDLTPLQPSESLASIPVELPEATMNDSWAQEGGDPSQHYDHILALKDTVETSSAEAGAGNPWDNGVAPGPVVSETHVFVMDGNGVISAHDRKNVSLVLWTSDVMENEDPLLGGGLAYGDNTVYAVSSTGTIAALSAKDGKQKWKHKLGLPIRSAPAISDNLLFFETLDSELVAVDTLDGAIQWQHRGIEEAANLLGTVQPAIVDDNVVVAYPSGEIYTLSKRDGSMVWADSLLLPQRTRATGTFSGVDANPVVIGNAVFGVSSNGLLAANALNKGVRIWELPVSSMHTPWISGAFLFLLSTDDQLLCVSARDGRVKWMTDSIRGAEDESRFFGPYLLAGRLVVLSTGGKAEFFSPQDGKKIGSKDIAENIDSPPAFADGFMYLLSKDGTLYQYR